jgi:hypothetical protein
MRRDTIVLDEMRAALEQVALCFAGAVKTQAESPRGAG